MFCIWNMIILITGVFENILICQSCVFACFISGHLKTLRHVIGQRYNQYIFMPTIEDSDELKLLWKF